MRIGIFGGSFDPVHTEHIRLAQEAVTCLALDTLFIMPAHTPPHKKGKLLSSDTDRLRLCELAFANVKNTQISDYEMQKGGTSYTFETCEYFRSLYKDAEIFWLVGTDMLRDFPTWKNPERILQSVTLAVCARNEKEGWLALEQAAFETRFHKKFAVVSYNGADVSSTKIRVLAGAGMDITTYVGEKCAAYICEKGLYAIPNADKALALEKESRREHSIRVAEAAAKRAPLLGVSERNAIAAALFHDCAKNLEADSPLLDGFTPPTAWGDVPPAVLHQFAGAYVAENVLGVTDTDILNAIRYHTSARENMSALEKLVFLADMIEDGRSYEGVEALRALFYEPIKGEDGLDKCLRKALYETVLHLQKKGGRIYPLTQKAYEYYR
ncbi:MAG: nicotinate (nicotinamide) nucleotide adenylyltransferase [Clostridia bacterium]|nr:nicotinate (nicotinamide) nucleotide adenylyltransferase [Clostridia bacterium]